MSGIKTILNKTRRRIVLNTALRRSGIGLLLSALVGLIIVVSVRVSGSDLPWQVFPALCGAGLLLGLIQSILTAPPSPKVAIQLDHYLGLKDRIGTAEAIRLGELANADSSFAELAKRDANRIAENLNVKAASPIVVSRAWGGALAATIVLCLTVMLMPPIAWSDPSEHVLTPEELAELDENRNEAAKTVDELLEELQQDSADPSSNEDFEVLDELAEQFRDKNMKPDKFTESRDKTTDKLNEMADKFAKQAERDQKVLDEAAEQFSELENKEGAESSPLTSELTEALKQGDYDRAAEIADEMDEEIGNMSEVERKKLADSLREMSDQLESAREQSQNDEQTREEEIRNDLRDQGLDEEIIDDLMDKDGQENTDQLQDGSEEEQETSTEGIDQQLQEEGVDSEVAEKLAEEIEKNKEESEASREANKTSEDLSEALEEVANEAEKAEENQDITGETDELTAEDKDQQQNQQRGEESQEVDQTQPQQDNNRNKEQQLKDEGVDSEVTEETEKKQDATETEKENNEQVAEQKREHNKEQVEESKEDNQKQQQKEENPQSQEECPECQANKPCNKHSDTKQADSNNNSSRNAQKQNKETSQKQQQKFQGDNKDQKPTDKLKKAIEELKKRSKDADRNQKNSQSARDAAREMMEKMTPEERNKFREWAEELKRENEKSELGSNNNTDGSPLGPGEKDVMQRDSLNDSNIENKENLDLRDPDQDQKTIAEWLSDESGESDPKRTDKTGGGTVVKEARKAAEQAVDESAVPTRYHDLIKRFFDKLPDTIDSARETEKKETDREGDS